MERQITRRRDYVGLYESGEPFSSKQGSLLPSPASSSPPFPLLVIFGRLPQNCPTCPTQHRLLPPVGRSADQGFSKLCSQKQNLREVGSLDSSRSMTHPVFQEFMCNEKCSSFLMKLIKLRGGSRSGTPAIKYSIPALGGNFSDLYCSLLSAPLPYVLRLPPPIFSLSALSLPNGTTPPRPAMRH